MDECDDKGSHDQPNTPNEQGQFYHGSIKDNIILIADELMMCQEAIKIILEEYIFPHYGVTLT